MPPQYDEHNDKQNILSNLPLLFAAGYPTSLEKITEKQLERFIPFMVQCSLGYLQLNPLNDFTEPEWWPKDIKILKPFRRPDNFNGDWFAKLKELVLMCYTHHNSVFLLRFCSGIAGYEPASLRFINNYNSTTSLYHRTTNKLLVTFRNENMLYDQPPMTSRKSLLPKSPSSHTIEAQMVEASLFDIYLCDNCDAELYSLEAYKEHEKTCVVSDDIDDDDDDVILVDENELNCPEPMTTEQHEYLSNFSLIKSTIADNNNTTSMSRRKTGSQQYGYGHPFSPDKQLRRMPNRARAVLALSKCHTIPISSPCGQLLVKQTRSNQTEEYKQERIERVERFCAAPPANQELAYNRYINSINRLRGMNSSNVTFRKPTEPQEHNHCHIYKWPRRQLSDEQRRAHYKFLHSLLLKSFRPLSVKVKRLSDTDIEMQKAKLRLAAQRSLIGLAKAKSKVVEFIDLCSSDEETDTPGDDMENKNYSAATDASMTKIGDENCKADNISMSMLANTPSFPVNQGVGVQPLRPSVFLFSNYQNNQDTIAKNNSIKHWLESQSTSQLQRRIPRLINIKQYATTTIRTTITAADYAT